MFKPYVNPIPQTSILDNDWISFIERAERAILLPELTISGIVQQPFSIISNAAIQAQHAIQAEEDQHIFDVINSMVGSIQNE